MFNSNGIICILNCLLSCDRRNLQHFLYSLLEIPFQDIKNRDLPSLLKFNNHGLKIDTCTAQISLFLKISPKKVDLLLPCYSSIWSQLYTLSLCICPPPLAYEFTYLLSSMSQIFLQEQKDRGPFPHEKHILMWEDRKYNLGNKKDKGVKVKVVRMLSWR